MILGFVCFLFGCKKDKDLSGYQKYSIKSGSHNSTPIYLKTFWNKCNISSSAYFTENSKYYLGDSDQFDWNKLDGFKLDYNSIPNNAAMVAWRYNTLEGTFEVAPYFNKNGIVFPDSSEIIKVNVNEVFSYNVSFDGSNATVAITKNGVIVNKAAVLKKTTLFTRVSVWFGGNRAAPSDLEVFIKR